MGLEQKVLLLAVLLRKKRRQWRHVWVHPITSTRLTEGSHYLLFKELEDDPTKFFNYFHMSRHTLYELLSLLDESINKQDTNMRRSIPPKERQAVACSSASIADRGGRLKPASEGRRATRHGQAGNPLV